MKKLIIPLMAAAAFAAYHFGIIQIPEIKVPEIKLPEITLPSGTKEEQFLEVAVPFVGAEEGKRNHAYQDIVGIWTVCYGETKGVKEGDYYTDAECDEMLRVELLDYREGLHVYFSAETLKERLPVKRDVAFTSLAYNAGVGAIGKSTAVKRLNGGDVVGACEALGWWNKAGGRVVRGLVNRRAREQELCLDGLE